MGTAVLLEPTAAEATTLREQLESEIRAGRMTFPVMSGVAVRARQAAAREDCHPSDIAEIIASDASLAARVLRLANSAIYAGLTEIRDLNHAISRLGIQMVVPVVVAAATKETFRSEHPAFDAVLAESWAASLHAAAAARLLGPTYGLAADEAFLCGLLHRAGEPILVASVQDLARVRRIERPGAVALRGALEALAPVAGASLLSRWGLPDALVRAVEYQSHPDVAPEDAAVPALLAAVVASIGRRLAVGEAFPAIAETAESIAAAAVPRRTPQVKMLPLVTQAEADGQALAASL